MLLKTYKPNQAEPRAEVHLNERDGTYFIEYYDATGAFIKKEELPGKTVNEAHSEASQWASSMQVLLG